jgi:hypothetical protein
VWANEVGVAVQANSTRWEAAGKVEKSRSAANVQLGRSCWEIARSPLLRRIYIG